MKRSLEAMGALELFLWVVESIPFAAAIGAMLTIVVSILFDIELASASLAGFLLKFVPGFLVGMGIMLAIGYFVGSIFGALLRGLFKSPGIPKK